MALLAEPERVLTVTVAPLALPSEDIGAALGALGSIRSGGASVATAIYVKQTSCSEA